MYGTCTENSNGRGIERPPYISLLNSSQKASRDATRRQINSADGNIAACKLQKGQVAFEGTVRRHKRIDLCTTNLEYFKPPPNVEERVE